MNTPFSPVAPPPIPLEHTNEPDIVVSFNAPHILQSVKVDGTRETYTVSNGGHKQVVMSVETWLSETPVTPPNILKIRATNRILVGGQPVDVLNDAMEYNGKLLAPSNPTASQYLALMGTKVVMTPSPTAEPFKCIPLKPESSLFQLYGKPTLYAITQVSIVLP